MKYSNFFTKLFIVFLIAFCFSFTFLPSDSVSDKPENRLSVVDKLKAPWHVTYVGYFLYDGEFRVNIYANTATGYVVGAEFPDMFPPDYNVYYEDNINSHTYTASPRSISGLQITGSPIGNISVGSTSLTYP